jgi:uncharacterized membrane protein YvlD (DUF360 family)
MKEPAMPPDLPEVHDTDNRAALAGHLARAARGRTWYSWIGSFVLWVLTTTLAVLFCNWVVPGFHADFPWGPVGFAVVLGVTGLLLEPLLVAGAVRLGWIGVLLLVLVGQALIVGLAAWLLPHVHVDGFWAAFLVSWIIGIVNTVVGWITTAGTDEALVGRLVAASRRHPVQVDNPQLPGVIFVQLDGVPFPVLHMSVVAGNLPTLSRWIRAGSHVLHEWTPKLPATTPASQMGILHGVIEGIPAFRWYDRPNDKVMVANRPADAALIEATLTTGRGLLVDGGASISNLFTGDAPAAALTMSRRARGGETTRRAVAQFVAHPTGLPRSLSRTISELGRDRFQARRAVRRDVQPRCRRTWTTALLRSVTNGALRDINTVLVAQHMLRGTRSVYVDYVDYDEVAHHAGILRPESLAALESIDAVLRQLELVATVSPRPYRFVVLSDHGQAQGQTFADRFGEELAVIVSRLARTDVAASDGDVEGWGRTRVLVDELATGSGVSGRSMRNASEAMQSRNKNKPGRVEAGSVGGVATTAGDETFHVFGSGNLGLIYVRGEEQRLTRGQLNERFPTLVPGLAEHPGIGFVVVTDEAEGPIVLGSEGTLRLTDGHVEGVDPLAPFGPHAAEFVLRVALRPEAPDIYVNSLLDEGTEEVAAFEDLVGCHGGLGGWQDRAFVVVPGELPFPTERVIGADSLHVALKAILGHLGHGTDAPDERSPTPPAAADAGTPAGNQ